MSHAPNQPEGDLQPDALDALLAQAHWPAPTPESAARLLAAWDACSPATRRRNPFALPLARIGAAAAAVVLVAGIAILCVHRADRRIADVFPSPRPLPPPAIDTPTRESATFRHVASRSATPYERWAVLYLSAPHSSSLPAAPGERPSSPPARSGPPDVAPGTTVQAQALVLALARVRDAAARRRTIAAWLADGSPVLLDAAIRALADPRLRSDAWSAAASAPAPSPEMLVAHFDDLHADYRWAAARLLGRACDAGHRQLLERMVQQNDHRREALAALLCCPDAQAAQFLERLEPNRSLNAQIRSARAQVERLCS